VYGNVPGTDPLGEEAGFLGEPEAANYGYGWAKRMLEIAVLTAARDGKCEGIVARPVNVYGASYGWFGEQSHVIPSLVKRMLDGEDPLTIWGDGSQVRNFIHVSDAARGFVEMSRRLPSGTVVNLGPKDAASIKDIVDILRQELNVPCRVDHDLSKPTGPTNKQVSAARLRALLPDYGTGFVLLAATLTWLALAIMTWFIWKKHIWRTTKSNATNEK